MSEEMTTLTADIVAAFVSNNRVAVGDIGGLIQTVHAAFAVLSAPETITEQSAAEPVVPVRSSIKPDYLVCLVCGAKQKTLKRHLATSHGFTPDAYRQAYGLKEDYPMVAASYSAKRSHMAKSLGLGRKPKARS